jgi:hypothetical protein
MGYTYRKIPIPLPTNFARSTVATTVVLLLAGVVSIVFNLSFAPFFIIGGITYPIVRLYAEDRRKSLLRFHDEVVLIARTTRFMPVRIRREELAKPSGVNYYFDEVRKVKAIDILEYIGSKANTHLFFSGRSGVGKSTCAQWLTMRLGQARVIFSFKPDDVWLKMGYPILDVQDAAPNPFRDAQSFVSAFLIANPITSQGIQASYILEESESETRLSQSSRSAR